MSGPFRLVLIFPRIFTIYLGDKAGKDVGLGVYRVDRRRGSLRSQEKGTVRVCFRFCSTHTYCLKFFKRKRSAPPQTLPGAPTKLTTQETDGAKLPLSAREEVWRLFDDTFIKEHDSFESFDAYLCERKVLLFRDTTEKKALQGFIILNTEDKIIEGT